MIFWVIFAYLRGVDHVLRFLHTQEGELASRVFVATYYGFSIRSTTHIRRASLLLYDRVEVMSSNAL
jgi:hypothetical protein